MNKDIVFNNVICNYDLLIKSIANKYSIKGYDREDLYQECITKLWNVLDEYNGEYEWSTFITTILNNYLLNMVKATYTSKRTNYTTYGEALKDIKDYDFDTLLNDTQEYTTYENDTINKSMEILNNFKYKDIVWSVLKGNTYRHVADECGLSRQRVHKIYRMFINKVKVQL